jgi:hypothetical protein
MNTAINTLGTSAVHYVTGMTDNSRAAGAQRYAVVATLVYGVLPKCEAVARFQPGCSGTLHSICCPACTRGSRCLTCANLLRMRSRLYSRAVLQWHHTQTGMQLSVVRACPGSHDRGARCI